MDQYPEGETPFPGHRQPNLPSELGFYDLREPEAPARQAKLAAQHGITGFAYWHYWFGNGRRILEFPFDQVLSSGEPGLPFCLAWANESWTGVWHGLNDKVLIEQTYPGDEDYTRHFLHLLPAFRDRRYLRIGGRPLFIVYLPHLLPDATRFTGLWNRLAKENGLGGIYFLGIHNYYWDHRKDGFDAKSVHPVPEYIRMFERNPARRYFNRLRNLLLSRPGGTYRYEDLVRSYAPANQSGYDFIPSVLPNWDNSPRTGKKGCIMLGASPELFRDHFRAVVREVVSSPVNPANIILVKSWNEWAEGNYLEPDEQWGRGWLMAVKDVLESEGVDSRYPTG